MLRLRAFISEITPTLNKRKVIIPVITLEEWTAYSELVEVLRLPQITTLRMQSAKYVPSDFFGDWANLKLQLNKKQHIKFASALLANMATRENRLINTPIVLSSVLIDPRFKILLSPQQNTIAMNHLDGLRRRLNTKQPAISHDAITENPTGMSELSLLLKEKKMINSCHENEMSLSNDDFFRSILNLRISENLSLDPIKYWSFLKHSEPELYNIICIVNAAAPTQVSVERAFSGLAFILTASRTRLTDNILEAILILRLNKSILMSNNVRIHQ